MIEDRLRELKIVLPEVPKPLGSYLPCVQTGNLLFLSGMLPLKEGNLLFSGKVGKDISIEDARTAAWQSSINALAVAQGFLGNLDRISRCVKITGYIASGEDFFNQPLVLNAASDLIFEVFGENGRHSRAAVGVACLPLNSPVEIEFILEVKS